jgi:hypothetical protein
VRGGVIIAVRGEESDGAGHKTVHKSDGNCANEANAKMAARKGRLQLRRVLCRLLLDQHSQTQRKKEREDLSCAAHAVRSFMLGWKYLTVGLVCRRDAGAGVVEGERANGELSQIECQPRPYHELPASVTAQHAATLWRPLEETSGRRRSKHLNEMTNRDHIYRTSNFVHGGMDEFDTKRHRRAVRVSSWKELRERR